MHPCVRALTKIALLMKLASVMILLTCMQVSAKGYSQEARLTLDMKQVPIGKVLKAIEMRTEYHFVYSSNQFPAGMLVDVTAKEKPVSDILTQLLEGTGFTFKKVDDLIVLTTRRTGDADREIKGRVFASSTSEPLAGVTVTEEKSGVATVTDGRGEFTIKVPENGVLVVSSVGYIAQRIVVGSRSSLDISLKETSRDLNEVVVVGYGTRK